MKKRMQARERMRRFRLRQRDRKAVLQHSHQQQQQLQQQQQQWSVDHRRQQQQQQQNHGQHIRRETSSPGSSGGAPSPPPSNSPFQHQHYAAHHPHYVACVHSSVEGQTRPRKYTNWLEPGLWEPIQKAVGAYRSIRTALRYLQNTYPDRRYDRLSESTIRGWFDVVGSGERVLKESVKRRIEAEKTWARGPFPVDMLKQDLGAHVLQGPSQAVDPSVMVLGMP